MTPGGSLGHLAAPSTMNVVHMFVLESQLILITVFQSVGSGLQTLLGVFQTLVSLDLSKGYGL